MNVLWKMCGIDVYMDFNIGKRFNVLGNIFIILIGEEDIDDIVDFNLVNIVDLLDEDEVDIMFFIIYIVSVFIVRNFKIGFF